jgi:hypothetical protein
VAVLLILWIANDVIQILRCLDRPCYHGKRSVPFPCSLTRPKLTTVLAAALTRRVTCADGNVVSNEACCALFPVLADLQANLFDDGDCGEDAHSALRLAFHDAIGFSLTKNVYVPFLVLIDGTIFIFELVEEAPMVQFPCSPLSLPTMLMVALTTLSNPKLHSLQIIPMFSALGTCKFRFDTRRVDRSTRAFYSIQFAAAVGVSNCPGAPRLKFLLGRPPPKAAAADLTIPEPFGELIHRVPCF